MLEVLFNLPFYIYVKLLFIIQFFQETKKFIQLKTLAVFVSLVEFLNHIDEFCHNVGEYRDTEKETEGCEKALGVGVRVEISQSNRCEGRDREVNKLYHLISDLHTNQVFVLQKIILLLYGWSILVVRTPIQQICLNHYHALKRHGKEKCRAPHENKNLDEPKKEGDLHDKVDLNTVFDLWAHVIRILLDDIL